MTILGIFAFQVENFPAMQFYVFGMPIFVHIPDTVSTYFPWEGHWWQFRKVHGHIEKLEWGDAVLPQTPCGKNLFFGHFCQIFEKSILAWSAFPFGFTLLRFEVLPFKMLNFEQVLTWFHFFQKQKFKKSFKKIINILPKLNKIFNFKWFYVFSEIDDASKSSMHSRDKWFTMFSIFDWTK